MIVKCSLCQQPFDSEDKLFEIRKERHEDFHKLRLQNIRTKSGIMFNKNVNTKAGKVTWKIVKEKNND